MTFLLASIPSPHTGVFHIFGRPIHLYGLMLLLAIVACIWLTRVREPVRKLAVVREQERPSCVGVEPTDRD